MAKITIPKAAILAIEIMAALMAVIEVWVPEPIPPALLSLLILLLSLLLTGLEVMEELGTGGQSPPRGEDEEPEGEGLGPKLQETRTAPALEQLSSVPLLEPPALPLVGLGPGLEGS